jgi:molecular chaperone DnaK (HSP70)
VPTNFGLAQKEALSKAAAAADLEVLQFISEPVAAVLAYDARPGASTSDKIVVVADLGGIRSDIAVVASRGGIYTVLATSHDFDVNGTKFDEKLMDYFSKEFLKKNKDVGSPLKNERATSKLRLESEAVKKALSLGNSASFSVESLSGGIDFTCTINRLRYELLSGPLLDAVLRLVQQTVKKADLDPLEVTDIILAGGMSHTPKIANNMKFAFPESTIWAPSTKPDAINPSELPSRGAAIQASLIADFEAETIRESCETVVTATPHLERALGVLTISANEQQGKFVPLVQAHTPVPVRRTAVIATPREGGDVIVKIVEGSHHIKVSKVEKSVANGGKAEKDSDDSDDSDDDSDDEEQEKREKIWKVGKTIAEVAVRGLKKGGKVEVQIDVRSDLGVSIIAREVGGKGGVRGAVDAPKA